MPVTKSKAKAAKKTKPAARAPVRRKAVAPKAKVTSAPAPAAKAGTGGSQASLLGFKPYKEKKGESYMNDKQVTHFRSILQAWKKQLMEEVDRTVHHMQDEAANYPDPNDRATQEEEITMELRTRDRERKLIKKIDEALVKLDLGQYGHCDECDVEIGIRRLEARPTATQCIDCKTLDEIREKQMA